MTEELDVNNELEQDHQDEVNPEVHSEVVEETKEVTNDEEAAKPIEEEPSKELLKESEEKVTDEPAKPDKVKPAISAYESMKDFDWDSIGKKHEIYDEKEK